MARLRTINFAPKVNRIHVLLQHRPDWRPGAVSQSLVKKYRAARGIKVASKKTKLMVKKSKENPKKPAITITKKDGEYCVQMEVMKPYNKDRFPNQYPYENKEPLMYCVGRTEKENARRKLMQERRQRRLDRQKRKYVQSTFKNMCTEICQRRYEEAIGLLPNQEPNYPVCPCGEQKRDSESEDTCSCDEAEFSLTSSDTDGDEWTVEFTPPCAKYEPDYKPPLPSKTTESQYDYLDFRIQIFDKNGQPVPRFFKGPNGKEVCSDLGGFYGPDGKWLVIGDDGFVAVDGRWCPMSFLGPDGLMVNGEDGFFVDSAGKTWNIGVDGYVNSKEIWVSYPVKKPLKTRVIESQESMWTCLGNVRVGDLVRRNFLPHNSDKRILKERLKELGRDDMMPTGKTVPRFRSESPQRNKRGSSSDTDFPDPKKKSKMALGKAGQRQSAGRSPGGAKTKESAQKKVGQTGNKQDTQGVIKKGKQEETKGKSKTEIIGPPRPGSAMYVDPYRKKLQKAIREKKKLCVLARMRGEGRIIPKSHLECFGKFVGGACLDRGGICTGTNRTSLRMFSQGLISGCIYGNPEFSLRTLLQSNKNQSRLHLRFGVAINASTDESLTVHNYIRERAFLRSVVSNPFSFRAVLQSRQLRAHGTDLYLTGFDSKTEMPTFTEIECENYRPMLRYCFNYLSDVNLGKRKNYCTND